MQVACSTFIVHAATCAYYVLVLFRGDPVCHHSSYGASGLGGNRQLGMFVTVIDTDMVSMSVCSTSLTSPECHEDKDLKKTESNGTSE